jgi:hypothetical protein
VQLRWHAQELPHTSYSSLPPTSPPSLPSEFLPNEVGSELEALGLSGAGLPAPPELPAADRRRLPIPMRMIPQTHA